MDALDHGQVAAACEGVDAVYYLIHGMGGDDFVETDRKAATNLADGVRAHGVDRIVYLSGLVPDVADAELSEHIQSRREVERILSGVPATVVVLRAARASGQRVHLVRDHPAGQRTDARAHLADVDGLDGAADRSRRRARGAGRRAPVRRPLASLRRGRPRPGALWCATRRLHLARGAHTPAGRRAVVTDSARRHLGRQPHRRAPAYGRGAGRESPPRHGRRRTSTSTRCCCQRDTGSWDWTRPSAARSLRARRRPRTPTRWGPCRRIRSGPAAVTTGPQWPRWSTRSRTFCRVPERHGWR